MGVGRSAFASNHESLRFLPIVFVSQLSSGHGDRHQRQHPKADQDWQSTAVVSHDRSGKEQIQDHESHVKTPVPQDGHKHAAIRVIEDPRHDNGHRDGGNDKQNDVGEGGRETPSRNPEKGQVPQCP